MRTFSPALAAHLASGATTLCHCWKLAPASGSALGFTDHDNALSFDGVTFEAQAGFEASEMEAKLGLATDNMEASGALSSTQLDAEKLRTGYFDKATVEIWRVNWQDVSQRYLLRKGTLGEVTRGTAGFSAEVRGLTQALDVTKGRLFQYACDAALGDTRCKVNLEQAAYKVSGSVLSVEQDRRLSVSGASTFAEAFFQAGTLTWTTGSNTGRVEEIKSHAKSASLVVIELWHKTAYPVAAGDSFTLRAGCDKQFATCRAKFSNGVNFRGFPHIPGTDFVTAFPSRSDKNNGASRN